MTEPELVEPMIRHAAGDFSWITAAVRRHTKDWCVVGLGAVNAYAVEHVYLPTLELVAPLGSLDAIVDDLHGSGFVFRPMPDGVIIQRPFDDDDCDVAALQVEIFESHKHPALTGRFWLRRVFGLEVPCACPVDAARSKLWLMETNHRREWRKALDQSDLLRLAERHPEVCEVIPVELRARVEAQRARDFTVEPDAEPEAEISTAA